MDDSQDNLGCADGSRVRPKVAIIGPWPPPVGGVSVHVSRLVDLLERDYDVAVFDPYRREAIGPSTANVHACGGWGLSPILRMARAVRRFDPDLIHIHVSGMRRFATAGNLLLAGLPAKKKMILTIHSGSFTHAHFSRGMIGRIAIRRALRRFVRVIGVSESVTALIRELGVSPEKTVTLPAFLPEPSSKARDVRPSTLVANKDARAVILAAGYAIRDYGFDLLADAIGSDPILASRCHVILCFYNTYDPGYVAMVEQRLKSLQSVTIHRDLSPAEFGRVLASCQVFVRPTKRDGDSVSLREAASSGKQIVASDCVARPVGAVLFRSGSVPALAAALHRVLQEDRLGTVEDRLEGISDQYRRCVAAVLALEI